MGEYFFVFCLVVHVLAKVCLVSFNKKQSEHIDLICAFKDRAYLIGLLILGVSVADEIMSFDWGRVSLSLSWQNGA